MARSRKRHQKKIKIGKSISIVPHLTKPPTFSEKVKKVQRRGEPLRIDQWNSGGSIPSTGLLLSNLGNITFNDDASTFGTRQETKVYLKHFKSRGTFSVNPTDDNNRIRVLLLKSKTGRPFNASEVFYEGANAPSLLMDGQVNIRNFEVISDLQYIVQEQDVGSVRPEYRLYNKVVKLDQVAKFNEMTSGTQEQPLNKGAQIYHVAFSDSATLPHPAFRLVNQVTFHNG